MEEYLYMPTMTIHPHTDFLHRSANNQKIFKRSNPFMAKLTHYMFEPEELCQWRGGLSFQREKVTVELLHSVFHSNTKLLRTKP